jgi:hypothetical protein
MARNEQITGERRRRNADALNGVRDRLYVDPATKDPNFQYRWINDTGSRVHDLTVKDDWEVVQDRNGQANNTAAMGAQVAVNAGTAQNGGPVRAVLVRKLKNYYDDDYAAAQRRIDDTEAAMKSGTTGEKTYVPSGNAGPLSIVKDA